jgi:hypothetical protein
MYEVLFRETNHLTWEIGLFFALIVLLALIKQLNSDAFYRLIYFWKTEFYASESSRTKLSTLKFEDALIFLFRGLVFAAFTYTLLIYWGYGGLPWVNYPMIFIGWLTYSALRTFVEWSVGLGFGAESRILHFQLRRATAKGKLSFVLSILLVVGVFGLGHTGHHWNVILIIYTMLFLWAYQRTAKPYFNLIRAYLVYFILYICTFEIAPLWLIVKYLKV